MIKLADLTTQHRQLREPLQVAMNEIIEGSRFIGGEVVTAFESEFAAYCNVEHCIGVGNGTDALEIAITALELPVGSEIILPVNSFVASAEAVVNNGHAPVFLDCQPWDHCLDVQQLHKAINPKTAAILVVHLFGNPVNMTEVKRLAEVHNLKIIEDCAQAHGAKWQHQTIGSIGDVSTFSFFPGKNLGAMGDAGAICSNDPLLANRCRMIANHGRDSKFGHKVLGRNSRLDALQAAILRIKLLHLEAWNIQRRANAQWYMAQLQDFDGLSLLNLPEGALGVYHQFVIKLQERDKCREFLAQHGIESGIHYPRVITHYLPFDDFEKATPNAVEFADTMLSIPVHQYLSDADKAHVVATLEQFF